jgi:hypothetical protein
MSQPQRFPSLIVRIPFRQTETEFSTEDLIYGPEDILNDFMAIEDEAVITRECSIQKVRTIDGLLETTEQTLTLGKIEFRVVDDSFTLEETKGNISKIMVSRNYYYENKDYPLKGLFLRIIWDQDEENMKIDGVQLARIVRNN